MLCKCLEAKKSTDSVADGDDQHELLDWFELNASLITSMLRRYDIMKHSDMIYNCS